MNLNVRGIYAITRKIQGKPDKTYIGSSKNISIRWRTHRCELNKNRHKNKHLQNNWNKYGESSFKFEILEIVTNETELISKENSWIFALDTSNRTKGFNVFSVNSNLRNMHSEETRMLMSINHYDCSGQNNSFYGKKHSEETRKRISSANLGRTHSPSVRSKMSESHPKGEDNHASKLKNEDIPQIIEMLRNLVPIAQIAKKYDVSTTVISSIRDGKSWVSLTGGKVECSKFTRVKMSLELAEELRNKYASGNVTMQQLANTYGIGTSAVNKIIQNYRWKREIN